MSDLQTELDAFINRQEDLIRIDTELDELTPRATVESTQLPTIERAQKAIMKRRVFRSLIEQKIIIEPLDYFEFGVSVGFTFQLVSLLLCTLQSRLFGFDTFTGLPEDWVINGKMHRAKGSFTQNGRTPQETGLVFDSRAQFYKGNVLDTVPNFLKTYENRRKFLNFDLDLYTGTIATLQHFIPFLMRGDVILFDEFLYAEHEFRAYKEFAATYKGSLRLIARNHNQFIFIVE